MIYDIRQYARTVLTFEYNEDPTENACRILFADKESGLLPPGLEPAPEGVMRWLDSRTIPVNRDYAEELLDAIGLSWKDTMGVIRICKGLSLNDSYWVTEYSFKGSFASYNLYDNRFSHNAALLAYTGKGFVQPRRFISTPELTTNGMLAKCWRRTDGSIWLYKTGTSGAANAGQEPYCEYYAAQIAKALGIKHISYSLKTWQGRLASVCELFTSKDVSYVPMWKIVQGSRLEDVIDCLKGLGDEFYNDFADMMVFDALVYNSDRHYSNFGLLFDSHTNKPLEYGPVFDNGLSLFTYAYGDDFKDLESYAKTRPCTLGRSFDNNAEVFMTDRQRDMLRRLINFRFKRHPRYNWPPERLTAVEQFIQRRVRFLLNL